MRHKPHPETLVATIAARQHGVISVGQLLRCGLSRSGIRRRVVAHRLFPVYRGVYAVGHPALSDRGRWKAATLALPGSVLSHRSAAELWEMLEPGGGLPHVTVPHGSAPSRRREIMIHRSRTILETRTTLRDGIPVTMPSRTLADLGRVASAAVVRRARRAAEKRGLPLDDGYVADRTESDLERDLLAICRRYGVPEPEVNVPIGPYRVDFVWRAQRLVVEVDGYVYHRGRQAMRDDNDRDLELELRGLRVVRIDDSLIADDPRGVAAAVLGLLARAS
jgi:very-short-patch-repair endonuclease